MKKLIAVIVALSLILSLSACGGTSSSEQGSVSEVKQDTLTIGLIQLVEHPSLDEIRIAFETELRLHSGYEDVVIDYQNGQNDPSTMNSICQKFVGDDVDMIVAIATSAAQCAAAATSDIPVVFAAVTDPVGAGLVGEDGAPDRNCTGTSDAIATENIFDLADTLTPGIKTYGFIYNLAETNSVAVITEAKSILDFRGISYTEACVTNSGEVTTAAQSLIGKVDAIFCPIDNTVAYAMPNLAQIATDAEIPVYVAADSMVNDGGLATVGVNYTNLGRQTADMAIEILSGKSVQDVPVEVLSEYSTVINSETASALGIPEELYK